MRTRLESATALPRAAAGLIAVIAAAALLLASAAAAPALTLTKLPTEMVERRYAPAAGLLPNGKVLIAGGFNFTGKYLKNAEVFDPATGAFEALAAEMGIRRDEPGFLTLPDGRLLIVGGSDEAESFDSAEVFNPKTGKFEPIAAKMTARRDGPGLTMLPNGKVLIAGGYDITATPKYKLSAELFDPATETFQAVSGTMGHSRYEPVVATLPNGKVIVGGGYNEVEENLSSTELFDPATNEFAPYGHEMLEKRDEAAHVVLADGRIVILGGFNETLKRLNTTELFNPDTGLFEGLSADLAEPRDGPVAVLLPTGQVFVAGGYNTVAKVTAEDDLKTAELSSVNRPAVTTAPATGVGTGGATLNGGVVSETAATAYFQYGTTTSYGSVTSHQSVSASIKPGALAAVVIGLAQGITYHFRAVAENFGGVAFGPDQTFTTAAAPAALPAPHLPPPVLERVTQSHRTWRGGSKVSQIARKKAPVGTTFSFTLNEQALVTFNFTQRAGGRKVKGKCIAQKRSNRRKPACPRIVTVGVLAFTGHAAANTVSFQGRISRSKKLRPGTYTVLISAANGAGRSAAKALTFTVLR